MKSNIIKKLVSLSLCAFLALGSLSSIKCFAGLRDIGIIGGSYEGVVDAKIEYKQQHPEDQTEYDCHHLIAKGALNMWAEKIKDKRLDNSYNAFLVEDEDQIWAPSITMEKADHEKTRSYFYKNARTNEQKEQNENAMDYIKWQANQIIYRGDIIGVLNEECEFIRENFGHKYDEALNQVWTYIKHLKCRWTKDPYRKRRCLKINNPYDEDWALYYPF